MWTLQKTKKAVEHECNGDTNCSWYIWNSLKKLEKGTGTVGNQRKNRDHSNYCIAEINHKTVKSSGGQRRLAVT